MNDHIRISDVTPRIQYEADGSQAQFSYPFSIFAEDDIEVYEDDARATSGYTVLGAGDSNGGTVTFDTPPASGAVVTLRRSLSIERTTDFQQSGTFRAKVINDELDYLTATLQQVADNVGRAVRIGSTDTDADLELPSKSVRANKVLGFDANGDVIATSSSSGTDGGVTEHGQLVGLSDDDHQHYHNDDRGDARYYTQSQVDTALGYKSDADHSHDAHYCPIAHIEDNTNPHGVTAAQVGALPVGTKLDELALPGQNTDLDATSLAHGLMSKEDKSKLDGIEEGATASQTGAEIVSAIDTELGSSGWQISGSGSTDITIAKSSTEVTLQSSSGADDTLGGATDTYAGVMLPADRIKLDGIESGATADQTDAEIETAYNNRVAVVSQAEAEAGVATTRRGWTAERVKQAIQALSVGVGGAWGGITGELSSQTDLQTTLDGKLSVMTPQQFGAVTDLNDAATRANNVAAFEAMFDAWHALKGSKPLVAIIGSFFFSGSFSPSGQDTSNVRDMTGLHICFDATLRTKGDPVTNFLPLLAWDGTAMSSHTFNAAGDEPWDGHPRWRTVDTADDWDKPTGSDSYRQQYVFFNTAGLEECFFAGRLRLQQGAIIDDLAAWGCARAITGMGAMHCTFPDTLVINRFRAGFVQQPKAGINGVDPGYQYPSPGAFCKFGEVFFDNVDKPLMVGPNTLDGTTFARLSIDGDSPSICHRNVFTIGSLGIGGRSPDGWAPSISAAADNGSGLIRLTATDHNVATGQRVVVYDVGGTSEANGTWTVTKIDDDTIDLQGSAFTNAYTSGGHVHRVLPLLQISEGSIAIGTTYSNNADAADGKFGSLFHLTGSGKISIRGLKRDLDEDLIVSDVTIGTSINGEMAPQGCDAWIELDQIARQHTTIPPGGIVQLEAGATTDSNNVYVRGGIKVADMGVEPVTVLGSATTGDVVTLDFPDRQQKYRIDSGALVFDTAPITVSGALTTDAHNGKTLLTNGNVTVPNGAGDVGFQAIIIAGGPHKVTFNSRSSAAMAAGDVMTIAVQSTTVINAVLTEAADLVSFS